MSPEINHEIVGESDPFRIATRIIIDHRHGALYALELHDYLGVEAMENWEARHNSLPIHGVKDCPLKGEIEALRKQK